MSGLWFKKAIVMAKRAIVPAFLVDSAIDLSKNVVTDAIANKIKDEASTRAYQLMAETHRSVVFTIVWQNVLLLTSLLLVYGFHSPIPFYFAYLCVMCYTCYSVIQSWPHLSVWLKTRSLHAMISTGVRKAINDELCNRQFYERKIIEYLGPDLDHISDEIAQKLHADIRAALANMAFTIVMAFIAFRVWAIPMLEHKALS